MRAILVFSVTVLYALRPVSEIIAVKEQFPSSLLITSAETTIPFSLPRRFISLSFSVFFPRGCFQVRVPEDTAPWKDILQISAQDADTNSKLVYSVHSSLHPDSTKLFHLDPKSGVLVMTETLDYERIAAHTLIVMVTTDIHADMDDPLKWSPKTGQRQQIMFTFVLLLSC